MVGNDLTPFEKNLVREINYSEARKGWEQICPACAEYKEEE